MSEITGLVVINILMLCGILTIVGYYLYKTYFNKKLEQKMSEEIKKTLKDNIKQGSDSIIPEEWLKNTDVKNLDGFMDSAIETNLSGKDLGSFLSNLSLGTKSQFNEIFVNMLSNDSALLETLSKKLGLSPSIAKPILVVALSGLAGFANRILTNMLSKKFAEKVEGAQKNSKIKILDVTPTPQLNSFKIAF